MPTRLLMNFILWPLLTTAAVAAEPVTIELAADGHALQPVVVAESAPERVRAAARTLADYLGKISGGEFRVVTGDGRTGITVGRPQDFPDRKLSVKPHWPMDDPTRREDYLLRSHEAGLLVLGSTELAVEHAVWDLLYRLGHRQFFPGEHWEVVPRREALSIAVDVHEHPDYLARRIWYGFGTWDYAAEPYRQWCARNRATSGVTLNTGHAYDGIIARNKATFAEHPEFLGLVDGKRKSTKLCISNPALRQLVVEDALAQLTRDPERDSVSVDPSDGLGWCECEHCRAIGSVSDRALTLANAVAAAVNEDHPGTLVGMYAYSAHSPPPGIRAHPQVVISVATAFIRGGYSVDELMSGWNKQGATLGVREYYSVSTWDRDLPGRSRGSDIGYVTRTIPHFHEQGARFFSSESSDNWAPNGLGYYLAARLLWDTGEADRVDALVADFLEKCFGEAAGPMTEFYRLIDGGGDPLLSDHLIGRMYRLLDAARRQTDDPAVQRRLDDLVLYTRYVELWSDYANADGDERQANFERMIRHVYRMRGTMMVHAKALYRDVVRRDKHVSIPDGATWNVPEDNNPWKTSKAFTRTELDRFVAEGIQNRPLRGFEPVAFGTELVPASRLKLNEVATGKMGLYSRGVRTYYTWIADPARRSRLSVSGGRIYKDRGDVALTLRSVDNAEAEPLTAAVPPDGKPHELTLKAPHAGLYTVTISDGGAGTITSWPEGQPMTVLSSLENRADFHGRWSLYFYVPKGTEFVGGYGDGPGELRDSQGDTVHTFDKRPGYFRVPVPPGEDGRLWRFHNCAGRRFLMTVPPSLARNREELLLPADLVERDQPDEPRKRIPSP